MSPAWIQQPLANQREANSVYASWASRHGLCAICAKCIMMLLDCNVMWCLSWFSVCWWCGVWECCPFLSNSHPCDFNLWDNYIWFIYPIITWVIKDGILILNAMCCQSLYFIYFPFSKLCNTILSSAVFIIIIISSDDVFVPSVLLRKMINIEL